MRKNFGAKPLCYPQPVFIIAAYGEDGTPNAMNAAWAGISEHNEVSLCLSAGHKTVKDILKRGAFTISMADAGHVAACDYVGIVSGNTVSDKFARAGAFMRRSRTSSTHRSSTSWLWRWNVVSSDTIRRPASCAARL